MDKLRPFKIPFVGLKTGIHHFSFDLDDTFFQRFENFDFNESKIKVDLKFEKKERFFILDFYIHGTIKAECDRCLEYFDQELLDEYRVYVKFDDEANEKGDEGEDVIYISSNETHLDISSLSYDFVNLSIPVQKICPPKKDGTPGCNKKVLAILDKKPNKENETDPRWSVLKNLK